MSAYFEKTSAAAQGVEAAGICSFLKAVNDSELAVHSFMFARNDKLIAETWWSPYHEEAMHDLNSVTKVFASTAMGLLIDEGRCSLDDLVISFFPDDVPDDIDPAWEQLRIYDILTMHTGHNGDALGRGAQAYPDNWLRGVFSIAPEHAPGSVFAYNGGASFLITAIVQKLCGSSVTEFLEEKLFNVLGIEQSFWKQSPDGINNGAYGLRLCTESLLKLGVLYLHHGEWDGQCVLSREWVEMATKRQVKSQEPDEDKMPDWKQGYGFQFWRCQHDVYRADGAYGQYIIVFPKHNAVIAMTSGVPNERMQDVLSLIWQHVLPAMHCVALSPQDEQQSHLNDMLISQKIAAMASHFESSPAIDGEFAAESEHQIARKIAIHQDGDILRINVEIAEGHKLILSSALQFYSNEENDWSIDQPSELLIRHAYVDQDNVRIELRHLLLPFAMFMNVDLQGHRLQVTRRAMPGRAAIDQNFKRL